MIHTPKAHIVSDELQQQFLQKILKDREKRKHLGNSRNLDYQKPKFNTPEYWHDYGVGVISEEEAKKDQASFEIRSRRAKDYYNKRSTPPNRHDRPAPFESRQYSKAMTTTAARDDRLTPQAKALLQIIVARTGQEDHTDTCKTTLADILSRSPRSIQRYISELVKFGYIHTQIKKNRFSGLYVGLRIWITETVMPYFKRKSSGQGASASQNSSNPDRTDMPPKKGINIYNPTSYASKIPWIDNFAYS